MRSSSDPFVHHPELRGEITDPLQSSFRTFTTARLAERMRELGLPLDWWHPDEVREAMRAKTLARHRHGDLWVFGYGSLMWDPAFRFTEVRRARLPGFARRFILKDTNGARGTLEAPGLMAALDRGPGCDGLLFRIHRDHVEEESAILWRREMVAPAYIAEFVAVDASGQSITALTFIADHAADMIHPGLTREEQVRFLATGTGFLGSSLDYLKNIHRKFEALGIHDEEVAGLLRDVDDFISSRKGT